MLKKIALGLAAAGCAAAAQSDPLAAIQGDWLDDNPKKTKLRVEGDKVILLEPGPFLRSKGNQPGAVVVTGLRFIERKTGGMSKATDTFRGTCFVRGQTGTGVEALTKPACDVFVRWPYEASHQAALDVTFVGASGYRSSGTQPGPAPSRTATEKAGAAAPAVPTCSREDVEGDWRRSDGANVPIVGVHAFKNGPGGNALLFNHPEGWWPKGQTKFTGIYREGGDRSCKLKATCATYDRTVSGNVVRRERACTLTIDPVKKRMTESGSSLFYTRDGAAKAAPAKPEAAAAVPTAQSAEEQAATSSLNAQQAATAKREIAEYEAQKKRIADEQAAKEAAYRKALADREALIAENERKAREARARWEAAAAACRAGDRSQCAPAPRP